MHGLLVCVTEHQPQKTYVNGQRLSAACQCRELTQLDVFLPFLNYSSLKAPFPTPSEICTVFLLCRTKQNGKMGGREDRRTGGRED